MLSSYSKLLFWIKDNEDTFLFSSKRSNDIFNIKDNKDLHKVLKITDEDALSRLQCSDVCTTYYIIEACDVNLLIG